MSISSEITALNTNLQNAKSAVTAKGGTIGDTGLAGLASEIATIPSGGGADTLPVEMEGMTGTGHVTAYDPQTGVITGDGFGTQSGTVWLLDRDTHTYKAQPTSSWSDTSITLTSPIDTSVIEGYTSLGVEDANHIWTTKIIIDGDIEPTSVLTVYRKNPTTGDVEKYGLNGNIGQSGLGGGAINRRIVIGATEFSSSDIVGVMIAGPLSTVGGAFLANLENLNQPIRLWREYWVNTTCMSDCLNFNQPIDFIGVETTYNRSIGDYFMAGCAHFNQPVVLATTVTSIGQYFLNNCTQFSQPLVIASHVGSIGNNFLGNTACPRIELHNTGSYGPYFLRALSSPYTIDVQTASAPPSNTAGSITAANPNAYTYIDGITIKGPYRQAWLDLYQDSVSPCRHIIDGGE